VLALPLQYLQNGAGLPGVDFLRAFPGGDADLEPDFDPARPIPLRNIIADHPDIIAYFLLIPWTISSLSRTVITAHSGSFPVGYYVG
jgi:hypothetical protein